MRPYGGSAMNEPNNRHIFLFYEVTYENGQIKSKRIMIGRSLVALITALIGVLITILK